MITSTSSTHEEQNTITETTKTLEQDVKKDDSANQPDSISSPKSQYATDAPKDVSTEKDIFNNEPTGDQVRKHLMNLIDQEIHFIQNICPKLGTHKDHIMKEVEEASEMFAKLTAENCQLKELKDLKKTVTKLKLQIPAKYRTHDVTDQQKDQQYNVDKKGIISNNLQKIMPRLHNKLFHDSSFCKTIQQRYDKLSRELKLCLLCFSVFPENALISRRLMVYWWIGEGFVPQEDDLIVGKTQEDHANGFFKDLMDKEFIEPIISKSYDRNVAICKMHPMIRAAIIMIADKVNFLDFDDYGNPKDFGKFDEIDTPYEIPINYPLGDPREFFDFYDKNYKETKDAIDLVDSHGDPTPFYVYPDNTNQLHGEDQSRIKENDKHKKYYFYRKKKIITRSYKVCLMGSGLSKGISWEKLHLLFNVKDDILEFKPEWFIRMKNVNMVFLGRWQSSAAHHIEVEDFNFKESLENMNHVRFFSLQGVSRISELPNSISKLESLLILDLRACHNLELIPKTIGALKFLTHLDMSECYLLQEMPKEISCLESLQVLKGFVVVESPGRHVCTLHDLINLEYLTKLSMYTHMRKFPQESHLDALQKLDMLRKLTILWSGHESNFDSAKSKVNGQRKRKVQLPSIKLIPKKTWVKGSMRRMNAFNTSTLGSRLEKLDLKCFPSNVTPTWLTPGSLKALKKLYIRAGKFSDLGQYQEVLELDDSPPPPKDTWNVKVLRLKYLDEIKMDWRELQDLFPKITSLEKVKCPRLTLFPCNEHGVWNKKTSSTT
ncbi:unnamed protein product [Lactuca saligna]|uniref:Disease resistance RPP13-like protein 4 n=1 Tax=Lactuca saligna TaxID=75948 RepID=A0AA35V3G7_LACSI|nr:unnamed protein product [Lactuca saligna]